MNNLEIHIAGDQDVAGILDIYAPIIVKSHTSFEEEIPTIENFKQRIDSISQYAPWLVCRQNKMVAGYAYAMPHRSRTAYSWNREVSVYIHEDFYRNKIGCVLYTVLFELLKRQGIRNLLAGISLPNEKSVEFHKAMGFVSVGIYRKIGYKFGKWIDVEWLEQFIGQEKEKVTRVIPYDHFRNSEKWSDCVSILKSRIQEDYNNFSIFV